MHAGDPPLTNEGEAPPVALYVHFPFCLSLCPYCDFVVYAGRDARGPTSRVPTFADAVVAEIGLRARSVRTPLRSVYLGGGTPSLMPAADIERILAAADDSFGLAPDAEITIEANPGSAERGDLSGLRSAGVNRISFGAQSFDADELRTLGRRHSPADIAESVLQARAAGFDNLSLDLLYDVPGQTIASWRDSLAVTLRLEPDHVSAYALNLDGADSEDGHLPVSRGATHWRAKAREGQDDDRAADMYEALDDTLGRAGLRWYEISNWARPGKESRHNLAYWRGDAWEAVGPGAHRFDGRTRSWNAARLDTYLAALRDGDLPPGAATQAQPWERTVLRLRTADGVAAADVGSAAAWSLENGLIEASADGFHLTLRGRLLSQSVFERLMPAE
jgi:putative oxygen-independent coproporphyrinogen III oxidase